MAEDIALSQYPKVATFIPTENQILVEPDFAKREASLRKLHIPDMAKKSIATPFGTVVAVGPGRQLESGGRAAIPLSPGDRVAVRAWQGYPIEVGGVAMLVMDYYAVIGVITDVRGKNALS